MKNLFHYSYNNGAKYAVECYKNEKYVKTYYADDVNDANYIVDAIWDAGMRPQVINLDR